MRQTPSHPSQNASTAIQRAVDGYSSQEGAAASYRHLVAQWKNYTRGFLLGAVKGFISVNIDEESGGQTADAVMQDPRRQFSSALYSSNWERM